MPPEPPAAWRRLRERIDIQNWMTPPPAQLRFDAPRILTVDCFASPPICDWIVERGRPRLRDAEVYHPVTGARLRSTSIRNNSVVTFDITQYDVILMLLRSRIAAVAGVTVEDLEPPTLLHYKPGQQFGSHYDFLDPEQPALARAIAVHGQRVATFLLYLNDGYGGGETEFPELDWRFKGCRGDALVFWSVGADGVPDRRTLHAGLTPTSGEKWVLSQWIRKRSA